MERIARLASYACRVGLDLPSSYVRLEWEMGGIDGPTSYCTVMYTDEDEDREARKQQEEDIVYLSPLYLIYPRPVVEKIYIRYIYIRTLRQELKVGR